MRQSRTLGANKGLFPVRVSASLHRPIISRLPCHFSSLVQKDAPEFLSLAASLAI